MNEEYMLCKAIRAAPDDNILRLAYADWLDEHPLAPCPAGCVWHKKAKKFVTYTETNEGGRKYKSKTWFRCAKCDGAGHLDDGSRAFRAELIRLQIALAATYPWPVELREREAAMLSGERYWHLKPGVPPSGTIASSWQRGMLVVSVSSVARLYRVVEPKCTVCRGGGYLEGFECPGCGGTGKMPQRTELTPWAEEEVIPRPWISTITCSDCPGNLAIAVFGVSLAAAAGRKDGDK